MIGVVFLDLKRELVDKDILLKKMESYGITGIVLSWFKSYLENRVKLKELNLMKVCQDLMLGVPQNQYYQY